jgi:hypothetical protein
MSDNQVSEDVATAIADMAGAEYGEPVYVEINGVRFKIEGQTVTAV